VFSAQIFQENTFLKTKPNFSLIGKYFPLTNFSNIKQTQESLESDFPKNKFQKTNIALITMTKISSPLVYLFYVKTKFTLTQHG
jgi:hypothetical protein